MILACLKEFINFFFKKETHNFLCLIQFSHQHEIGNFMTYKSIRLAAVEKVDLEIKLSTAVVQKFGRLFLFSIKLQRKIVLQ